MRLPTKVKVGGHWYKVTYPYRFTERNDIVGQHDYSGKEIRIASETFNGEVICDSSIVVAFIHEILHAVDYVSGSRIFEENETTIEVFSEILFSVLVDNGWLKLGAASVDGFSPPFPDGCRCSPP